MVAGGYIADATNEWWRPRPLDVVAVSSTAVHGAAVREWGATAGFHVAPARMGHDSPDEIHRRAALLLVPSAEASVEVVRRLRPALCGVVIVETGSAHEGAGYLAAGADDFILASDDRCDAVHRIAGRVGSLLVTIGDVVLHARANTISGKAGTAPLQRMQARLLLCLWQAGGLVHVDAIRAWLGMTQSTANAVRRQVSDLRRALQSVGSRVEVRSHPPGRYRLDSVANR